MRQKKWQELSQIFGPFEFKALVQIVCLFFIDSLFQLRIIRSKSQTSNANWLIGVSEVSTFLSGLGEAVENSIVLEVRKNIEKHKDAFVFNARNKRGNY